MFVRSPQKPSLCLCLVAQAELEQQAGFEHSLKCGTGGSIVVWFSIYFKCLRPYFRDSLGRIGHAIRPPFKMKVEGCKWVLPLLPKGREGRRSPRAPPLYTHWDVGRKAPSHLVKGSRMANIFLPLTNSSLKGAQLGGCDLSIVRNVIVVV